MIKFALTSSIHGFSLEELFLFGKEAGFDGIEYVAYMRDLYRSPKRIYNLSKKYDIPVISLHQPPPLVVYTPYVLYPRMASLANYFPDVTLINHHLSGLVNTYSTRISFVNRFLRHAKKDGITVTFESNPKKPPTFGFHPLVTRNPKLFGDYCIAYDLPITLDTSHIADNNFDIVEFFTLYRNKIKLIHISDYKPHKQHLPFGQGDLPLKQFFKEIKKTSWKGLITFEVCKFPGMIKKTEKLNAIKSSLEMIKKQLS